MTLASLKARIDSELSMLGAFSDPVKESIIADSLRQFIRRYEPIIQVELPLVKTTVQCSMVIHTREDFSSSEGAIFSAIAALFTGNDGETVTQIAWKAAAEAVASGFVTSIATIILYKDGVEFVPGMDGDWTFEEGTRGGYDVESSHLIVDRHEIQLAFDALTSNFYEESQVLDIMQVARDFIVAHSTDPTIVWADLSAYITSTYDATWDTTLLGIVLKIDGAPVGVTSWSIASNEQGVFDADDSTINTVTT
jgi:hypothetical protein